MKKIICVMVLVVVLLGSMACLANGPWPEPPTTGITEQSTTESE